MSKWAEGIYTEDFIKSFYSHLLNEVGEESADILIQEFQREKKLRKLIQKKKKNLTNLG